MFFRQLAGCMDFISTAGRDLPSGNVLRLEYADDAALLCTSTQEATLRFVLGIASMVK